MESKTIIYTLTAPLSHIGETASTGSYFNTIKTAGGKLPVVTGNSIRGRLRDCIAMHLLRTLNATVNKEVFNVLFSGGNIGTTLKDSLDRARAVRAHFPVLSLLGGGINTQIIQGKLQATFAYPICKESQKITRIQGELQSWHSLIDEIEFTRTDDSKNDMRGAVIDPSDIGEKKAKASTQMRYGVQYLAAGTKLFQKFSFLGELSSIEYGCFLTGLAEWFRSPTMGGGAAKGFGSFDADYNNGELVVRGGDVRVSSQAQGYIDEYSAFIKQEGIGYLYLLEGDGNGKGKNDPD